METYCGKSCEKCTYKTELACPGCKEGPGRAGSGDCKIGKCCREKGHAVCEGCDFKQRCGHWIMKDTAPKARMEEAKEAEEKETEFNRLAAVYGKWLWRLFWVRIAAEILGLFGMLEALELFSSLACTACGIAGLIFYKRMASVNEYYKLAARWGMILTILNGVNDVLPESQTILKLVYTLILIVPGLIASYYKYVAFEETAKPTDYVLAQNWKNIWSWNIGLLIATPVAAGVAVLFPMAVTVLLVYATLIAQLVVSILEFVYLYQMAKLYRD